MCLPHSGRERGRCFWSLRPHLLTTENKEEFAVRWQYWTRQRNSYRNALEWWILYAKKKIKSFFRWKSREAYNIFHAKHQRLYVELRQAYDNYFQNPASLTNIHRIKAKMLSLQRDFSQNFARVNETFVAGESLSTFQLGERRKRKTTITRLKNDRGEILHSSSEIEQRVIQYFTELYRSGPENTQRGGSDFECERVIPQNDEVNSALVSEITVGEIREAIKSSPKRKSPGADGLTAEWMSWAFEIVYRELHAVMNELLSSPIPASFVEGTIVLVKKRGRNEDEISSYRPISLCNTDSRVFSRIMRRRLTVVLERHNVLTASQKCGQKRSIFGATLALKDRIAAMIARKTRGKLISFDLDHAYDRVSLPFLRRTMLSLGVNPDFVSLLERYSLQAGSRIVLNGHMSARFSIERSVRQGDPLSMLLFCIYMHPLLVRLERVCAGELCVAYADDITVIATTIQMVEEMNEVFSCFELAAGAKLNRQKTLAIDVGYVEGNPLEIPWLRTVEKVKVLGIIYTNSIRLMIKLNWDAQVAMITQQIWLHSMRNLTLHQKTILLNTFITSKVWYLASNLPPYQVHTAKITAIMGRYLFRGFPARIPMQQLARRKTDGGLNLQLPAIKCKALCINRHLQEIDSLPYYKSFFERSIPPPSSLPCLKLLCQEFPALPTHIRENPSSGIIHQHYLGLTEKPRVERNQPNLNWPQIWKNISSRRLTSKQRSDLYTLINEKTEHRKLMHVIQRADGTNCQHCGANEEDMKHKFCDCPRVAAAWTYTQQRISSITGVRQTFSFDQLFRPALTGIGRETKHRILKLFIVYISFVNSCATAIIDISALDFEFNCN